LLFVATLFNFFVIKGPQFLYPSDFRYFYSIFAPYRAFQADGDAIGYANSGVRGYAAYYAKRNIVELQKPDGASGGTLNTFIGLARADAQRRGAQTALLLFSDPPVESEPPNARWSVLGTFRDVLSATRRRAHAKPTSNALFCVIQVRSAQAPNCAQVGPA
jgi:hypothetical protein